MNFVEMKDFDGFKQWGTITAGRPYVIVYDKIKKEYTASTKTREDKTIYILDYGEGVQTLEEAKEAVLKYHKKVLS